MKIYYFVTLTVFLLGCYGLSTIKRYGPNYDFSKLDNKNVMYSSPIIQSATYNRVEEIVPSIYYSINESTDVSKATRTGISNNIKHKIRIHKLTWKKLPKSIDNVIQATFKHDSTAHTGLNDNVWNLLLDNQIEFLIAIYDVKTETKQGTTSFNIIDPLPNKMFGSLPHEFSRSKLSFRCVVFDINNHTKLIDFPVSSSGLPIETIDKATEDLFETLLYRNR